MSKKIKIPKQKPIGQQYTQGVNLQLGQLPKQISVENQQRAATDASRIAAQQALQTKFGPTQAAQQVSSLNAIAPGYMKAYQTAGTEATKGATTPSAYESRALSDLSSGYNLPPALAQEVTNTIRGRQALSGNTEGNAPISAEAAFTGSAMNQMYQQRMQNAATAEQLHGSRLTNLSSFLSGGSPVQQIAGIAPVSPDRSFAYVNPNAGYLGLQAGSNQYANQLAAAGLQQSGQSQGFPWGQALSSAGQVASAFSDDRLKRNVHKIGQTPSGLNIYKYIMKANNAKMVGGLASDVESKRPDAVHTDPSGLKLVDYGKVDVPIGRYA